MNAKRNADRPRGEHQHAQSWRRASLACGIAAALVLGAPRRAAAADAAPAPVAAPRDAVRVSVADGSGDTETMIEWMRGAAEAGMKEAGVEINDVAADRELRIEVTGALLDYTFLVGVRGPSNWVGQVESVGCECTDDELAARVRVAVAKVAPDLRAPQEATESGPKPAGGRLGRSGKIGAAAVGVGAAAVVGGVIMLALPPRWSSPDGEPERETGKTFRLPGGIVAGIGVALVVAGAVLIHRDRKARRLSVSPAVARGFVGAGALVRF